MIHTIYSLMVGMLLAYSCYRLGRKAEKRNHQLTPCDKTILHVYVNGTTIVGPIRLSDLALTAKYGSFSKEDSIVFLNRHISNEGVDVAIEYMDGK